MKLTKSIAGVILATLTFGVLAGCFVETPGRWHHRHHSVFVIR